MAQHFLLSAASRTLSLRSVYKAGEAAAYQTFCEMRWPETNGEAVCPQCNHDETYKITTRRKFKCKACAHQFSVTSSTIFASRKMDFVDLLAAIVLTVNASKGISMVQLSRDLDCQYKTAFVLAHKLREAIAQEIHTGEVLNGHVEIDGAYFGGHIRPRAGSGWSATKATSARPASLAEPRQACPQCRPVSPVPPARYLSFYPAYPHYGFTALFL